jgi:hypothetical protein
MNQREFITLLGAGVCAAAIAYNEDSPHCPAARGKILWRKI